MTVLIKGANAPVPTQALTVRLTWTPGTGVPDVDLCALVLGPSGRVRSDDDLVFFNAPRHGSGAVSLTPAAPGLAEVVVDAPAVEPAVDRVVVVASVDDATVGRVSDLAVEVRDASGASVASVTELGAGDETALLVGELYRRDGGWRFRAVAQGWTSGLAGLATDFGVTVDDSPDAGVPEPQTPASGSSDSGAPESLASEPLPPEIRTPESTADAQRGVTPGADASPAAPGAITLDKGRVKLRKGEKVSLTKTGSPPLSRVFMGLGWSPATSGGSIDLDASVIAFDENASKLEIVWFSHQAEFDGAIRHSGDNLTGEGEGDDERIDIDLSALPAAVRHLVFTINSFGGTKFTAVAAAYARLVDADTGAELVRFRLTDSERSSGVIMAALSRTGDGSWQMRAIGEFHNGWTVKKLVKPAAAVVSSWR